MAFWQGDPSLSASPPPGAPSSGTSSPNHANPLSLAPPHSSASTIHRQPFNPTLNATPHSDLPTHATTTRPTTTTTTPSYHSTTLSPPTQLPPPTAAVDEIAWGPLHPCFPHANPYVAAGSAFAAATRIIRIKRDWLAAGDLAPSYSNLYPEILEPVLSEEAFRELIRGVNMGLESAFDPWGWRNVLDGVVGVATGWLSDDLGLSGGRRRVREVEKWVDDWNRTWGGNGKGEKQGVRVIPLSRTGFMTLDIEIPDPKLGEQPGGDDEVDGVKVEGQVGEQRLDAGSTAA